MTRIIAALLFLFASPTFAVSVIADLPDQTTTHCVLELDTVWGPDTITVGTTTRTCAFDVSSVPVGSHVVRMRAVKVDATWGRLESAPSAPLAFTRPGVPAAPSGLTLTP